MIRFCTRVVDCEIEYNATNAWIGLKRIPFEKGRGKNTIFYDTRTVRTKSL